MIINYDLKKYAYKTSLWWICLQMFTYMKKVPSTLPNLYGILGLNIYINVK